jgi:hypothetical protein
MDWLVRLFAGITATLVFVGLWGADQPTPAIAPATTSTALTAPPRPLSVPSTTTLPEPPADALCPQWWGLALEAGWTEDLLPTLDYVMWRESRCLPDQHNTTLNRDGSTDVGLTQINDRSWCFGTRWYPNGYLQTVGVLNYVGCNELFDPYINLKAAKEIYDYSLRENDAGWQPWSIEG